MAGKRFGSLKRDSRAQLPSGTEKDPIAVAIQSISGGIIDALQKSLEETLGVNKEADVAIETAVDSVSTAIADKDVKITVVSAIQTLEETIKDRFTAVLMAMYGTKSVSPKDGYQKYSSWIKTVGKYAFPDKSFEHAEYELELSSNKDGGKSKKLEGSSKNDTKSTASNINIVINGKDFDIKSITSFIDIISNTNLKINKNVLSNGFYVVNDCVKLLNSFNNIKDFSKIKKAIGPIKDLFDPESGTFTKLIENINNINKGNRESKSINNISGIGNIIHAIIDLQNFDKKKYKNLVYGIKSLVYLTANDAGPFARFFGIKQGLISALLNNIKERGKEVESSIKGIDAVTDFLGTLKDLTNLDIDDVCKLSWGLEGFNDLFIMSDKELGKIPLLFDNIQKFHETYTKGQKNKSNIAAINQANNLLVTFNTLGKDLSIKHLMSMAFVKLPLGQAMLMQLPMLWKNLKAAAENTKEAKKNIKVICDTLSKFNDIDTKKIDAINLFIKSIGKINKSLATGSVLGPLALGGLFFLDKEITKLNTVINKINKTKIKPETNKNLKELAIILTACTGIMLIGAAFMFIPGMAVRALLFTVVLTAFVWSVVFGITKSMKGINMSKLQGFADDFCQLVIVCGAVLLIAGVIMNIDKNIAWTTLAFAVILGAFITLTILGITKAMGDADINKLTKFADDFCQLVIVCGAVLLIAGVIMNIDKNIVWTTLAFAAILGAFMSLTILGINKAMGDADINKLTKFVDSFNKLVLICGAVLVIGGLMLPLAILGIAFAYILKLFIKVTLKALKPIINGKQDWGKAAKKMNAFTKVVAICGAVLVIGGLMLPLAIPGLLFGVVLSAFILLVVGAVNLATRGMKKLMNTAEQLGILIGILAGVMIIGAFFMGIKGLWGKSLLFGVVLGVFLLLVVGAVNLATRGMKKLMMKATQFGILVAMLAGIMLIGAAFMFIPGMFVNSLKFAIVLGIFMAAVCFTIKFTIGKLKAQKIMPNVIAFAIIVAICGAVLLIGASILNDDGMIESALAFAAISIVFIGAFALIVYLLGKIKLKNLITGIVALAIITAIIWALSEIFVTIAEIANMASFWDIILILASMVLAVAIIGALMIGIGALCSDPVVLLAVEIGAVVLAEIAGIIWLFAEAIKNVASANDALANMKEIDTKKFGSAFEAFTKCVGYITGSQLTNPLFLLKLGAVATAAYEIQITMSNISAGVKAMAELSIPIYDDQGKVCGRRELTPEDFTNAAENVKEVISVLGRAIIETYELNPEMFEWKLIGDNPFASVCKSCSELGPMISKIAEGVKEYADMRITTYDKDGNAVGSRPLVPEDFTSAAENVKEVISVLGRAIIDTYEENPDIFDDPWIGDTPFVNVVESCEKLGPMISTIAKSVKDYADLRIDTYDANGQKNGSRSLNKNDFINAATNVKHVISILGGAIMDTYNENPDMFDWNLFTDNPFVRTIKSCTEMSKLIDSISASVKNYASLRIDTYDETGSKVVGSRAMTPMDFIDAAVSIKMILTSLGGAIIDTYNSAPWMFVGFGDNTIFGTVKKSLDGCGFLISEAAFGVKNVMELDLDLSESNITKIKEKVSTVLKILSYAIQSVAYTDFDPKTGKGTKVNDAFADQSLLSFAKGIGFGSTKKSDTPVGKVIMSMTGAGKLVSEGVKAINDILKLPEFDTNYVQQVAGTAVYVLVGAITDTYERNQEAFDDPGWLDSNSDSGVALVKKAMKGSGALVQEATKTVEMVNALKIDTKSVNDKIFDIMNAIPQGILNATIYYGEGTRNADGELSEHAEEVRDFWDKGDDADNFTKITDALKGGVDLIKSTLDIYKQLGDMLKTINMVTVGNNIQGMMNRIPNVIMSVKDNVLNNVDATDKIVDAFTSYNKTITGIVGVYKETFSSLDKIGAIKDPEIITKLGNQISKMLITTSSCVNLLNGCLDESAMAKFDGITRIFSDGIKTLTVAFNTAPEDTKRCDNIIYAIKGVNNEISHTPDMTNFTTETQQLGSFVRTVNSINTFKLNSLTTLANALTTMSSKLGSLEKLTDVLANKVAVVLSHLTKRLDQSATTIKVAEKIQNERHKKITEALTQLRKLMSEPLNVSVTHKQEPMDQTALSNTGTSTTDKQQVGGSTNVGTGDTTTSPASPSTPASNNSNKPKTQSKENKPNYLTGDSGNAVTLTNFSSLWQNEYKQHHAKSNSGGGGRTGANK